MVASIIGTPIKIVFLGAYFLELQNASLRLVDILWVTYFNSNIYVNDSGNHRNWSACNLTL